MMQLDWTDGIWTFWGAGQPITRFTPNHHVLCCHVGLWTWSTARLPERPEVKTWWGGLGLCSTINHPVLVSTGGGLWDGFCFPEFGSFSHTYFSGIRKSSSRLPWIQEKPATMILNSALAFFGSFAFSLTRPPRETPRLKFMLLNVFVWACFHSLALEDPTAMTYNSRWQPVIHVPLRASV